VDEFRLDFATYKLLSDSIETESAFLMCMPYEKAISLLQLLSKKHSPASKLKWLVKIFG
jgi:hypothetical protein